ncbi:MAG: hypothetical protein R2796_04165 [Chitinophagaceae bacterium]|nr:hypothetical protein [Chitinophagaceae bacterium]MCB0741898.1 hypothetical protein [Chitinophagaceae bacterium]HQV05653.1 hypothetical protein [Chitinophagaceae bacterium]
MNNTEEYQKELQKVQDKDFTHNWVSSSAFLFYLQIACFVIFLLGACFMLYTQRFSKTKVEAPVQSSSLYTPQYK